MPQKKFFIAIFSIICTFSIGISTRSEGLLNTSSEAKELIGSRWILISKDSEPFEIEFGKNDELITYKIRLGRGAKPWWNLEGKNIELVFNNGLSNYKGKLISKNLMRGTLTSWHSSASNWSAKRIRKRDTN